MTFLATDTRTPHIAKFDGGDAKKVAHYMLRWESTPGETGAKRGSTAGMLNRDRRGAAKNATG